MPYFIIVRLNLNLDLHPVLGIVGIVLNLNLDLHPVLGIVGIVLNLGLHKGHGCLKVISVEKARMCLDWKTWLMQVYKSTESCGKHRNRLQTILKS